MFSIGKTIKKLREEIGKTQSELGKELELSSSTIAMYETDKRTPDINTLISISNYFNVSIDYLIGKSKLRNYNETNENITELIDIYNKLTDKQKQSVLNLIKAFI